MINDFRVDLSSFRGPLDLLLYLVRKHEVDLFDIPIATITAQYAEYLEVIEQVDVNAVGEFLELASTLVEIKSRQVLPTESEEEEIEDPRSELVQHLLEYKRYREAASLLEDQSRQWQQRFHRMANDLPPRQVDISDRPVAEVELWDLVSAFGRVMREHEVVRDSSIVYDDTPIQVHMQHLHEHLATQGRIAFSEAIPSGMQKSNLIGVFLALLELVRHHSVLAEQQEGHGEIWLIRGEQFTEEIHLENVDGYEGGQADDEAEDEAEK